MSAEEEEQAEEPIETYFDLGPPTTTEEMARRFRLRRRAEELYQENAGMRALLEQITDTWWSENLQRMYRLMEEAHDWLVQHPKEQP